MLIRFRCKNFRSIRDEQELSFIAAKTRSDERNESLLDTPAKGIKGLRCAAIYGANASGKSNVLRAMQVFSTMISRSQRQWNPAGGIPTWDPFLLDDMSRTGDTEFETDFVVNSLVYSYGFRFNASAFLEEWLVDNTGRAKTLFRRKTQDSTTLVNFPGKNLEATSEDSKHLELIKLQTRPNSLFLSAAAQGNHDLLSKIFMLIGERFETTFDQAVSLQFRTAEICSSPDRKEQIKALLTFADIGVVDVEVAEEETSDQAKILFTAVANAIKLGVSEAAKRMGPQPPLFSPFHSIKMVHRGADGKSYPLAFVQESKGTSAYFRLLGPLLDDIREGRVVLIDELESSLHPHLARQIVRMFNSPELNPHGAQLIFTTHDTNLLDLGLLRRDQVWFTEKDQEGATSLKPLSDYKPRKDQDIAAAYLNGRFGAIPFLDEQRLQSIVATVNDDDLQVAGKSEAH